MLWLYKIDVCLLQNIWILSEYVYKSNGLFLRDFIRHTITLTQIWVNIMLCLTVQTGNMKSNLNHIKEKDISCKFSQTASKLKISPLFENVYLLFLISLVHCFKIYLHLMFLSINGKTSQEVLMYPYFVLPRSGSYLTATTLLTLTQNRNGTLSCISFAFNRVSSSISSSRWVN